MEDSPKVFSVEAGRDGHSKTSADESYRTGRGIFFVGARESGEVRICEDVSLRCGWLR